MPDKAQTVYAEIGKGNKIKRIHLTKFTGMKPLKIRYHVPNKRGMGRGKGNSLERDTAKILSAWIYNDETVLKRTPLSGGWASGKMGDVCFDPERRSKKKKPVPIYVECRSYKSLFDKSFINWIANGNKTSAYAKWLREVEKKAKNKLPMLVVKGNGTDVWVFMLHRWLTENTRGRIERICDMIFWAKGHGKVFAFQLEEILFVEFNDGKEFIRKWKKDGGIAQIRGLSKRYIKSSG